jgi:hypothetical protein
VDIALFVFFGSNKKTHGHARTLAKNYCYATLFGCNIIDIYIYIDLDTNEQELLLIPVKKKQ